MSFKAFLINTLISEDIAKLEAAFDSIAKKASIAEAKIAAEIQLEIAKAKAIFTYYKPNAEVELAKIVDEISLAEYAIEEAIMAEVEVDNEIRLADHPIEAVEPEIKNKVKKTVKKKKTIKKKKL